MKKIFLPTLIVSVLFFGLERVSETQTKPEKIQSKQDKDKPEIVALKSGEPDEVIYDAGTARFLASSEDTKEAQRAFSEKRKPVFKGN